MALANELLLLLLDFGCTSGNAIVEGGLGLGLPLAALREVMVSLASMPALAAM